MNHGTYARQTAIAPYDGRAKAEQVLEISHCRGSKKQKAHKGRQRPMGNAIDCPGAMMVHLGDTPERAASDAICCFFERPRHLPLARLAVVNPWRLVVLTTLAPAAPARALAGGGGFVRCDSSFGLPARRDSSRIESACSGIAYPYAGHQAVEDEFLVPIEVVWLDVRKKSLRAVG
jgi:hypothetical protein